MTKSHEGGDNEISEEAKRESTRTEANVCEILARLLAEAKAAEDTERVRKIIQAQKYYGCRNIRKRKGS